MDIFPSIKAPMYPTMVLASCVGKQFRYKCIHVNIALFAHAKLRTYGTIFIQQLFIKEKLERTKHVAKFHFYLHHTLPSKLSNEFYITQYYHTGLQRKKEIMIHMTGMSSSSVEIRHIFSDFVQIFHIFVQSLSWISIVFLLKMQRGRSPGLCLSQRRPRVVLVSQTSIRMSFFQFTGIIIQLTFIELELQLSGVFISLTTKRDGSQQFN